MSPGPGAKPALLHVDYAVSRTREAVWQLFSLRERQTFNTLKGNVYYNLQVTQHHDFLSQ